MIGLSLLRPAALALALSAAAADAEEARKGSFVGDSNHVTTGGATLAAQGDGWVVELGEDFSHDGAPDPKVALGAGDGKPTVFLGDLRSLNGAQSYAIPDGAETSGVDRIWIWCQRYSVPLGHALLD